MQGDHARKMVAEAINLCGLFPMGSKPLCELQKGWYAEHVPLQRSGLFGNPLYSHFAIWPGHWDAPLLVEAMRQAESGSKDRQLSYICETIGELFPVHAVLVLEGAAFHEGHFGYLRVQLERYPHRFRGFFRSVDSFRDWLSTRPKEFCNPSPGLFPSETGLWPEGELRESLEGTAWAS